jgi:hypothetical protein
VANSIPGFLALRGRVGIVEGPSTIKDLSEAELQKGICSASLPLLIRQQYPGTYDGWKDADLERTVLAKHPEYRDALCILPTWIDAAPHDIVKYEITRSR